MSAQFGKLRFLEEDTHWEDWNVEKPLTICTETNDDLAQIFSRDDSTVDITREQAIAYAHLFVASPGLFNTLQEVLAITNTGSKQSEGERLAMINDIVRAAITTVKV